MVEIIPNKCDLITHFWVSCLSHFMSPQNHQKCDLMFTLPKSDILHFNQSQVQNRHKVHRTKCQMTFPHVLRRDNTWGTPPKVHKSTKSSSCMRSKTMVPSCKLVSSGLLSQVISLLQKAFSSASQ